MNDWREELIEKMAKSAWEDDGIRNQPIPEAKATYLRQARAALAIAEPVIREQADDALREENARLREALKPFARAAEYCEGLSDLDHKSVLVGNFRAAATAIREGGK